MTISPATAMYWGDPTGLDEKYLVWGGGSEAFCGSRKQANDPSKDYFAKRKAWEEIPAEDERAKAKREAADLLAEGGEAS